MTNFEKYFDDLTTASFGLLDGKPDDCYNMNCNECGFGDTQSCGTEKMEWLKAEYEEPKKINIPVNTPLNTRVLVSDDGKYWIKRYYAGNMNGTHYVWNEGRTSWTSGPKHKTSWEYMKLYNEEE